MYIKLGALKRGSRVAAVSSSWGGPGTFPHRFEAGKRQLEEAFEVELVCMEHTLAPAEWLAKNPRARARDLMQAFSDPTIDGIISSIGGDDSIRLIPYLDFDLMRNNPKVYLGYSDSTVTHFACLKAGLVSFFGPSVMAGFAENGGLFPYMVDSVRKTLFSTEVIGELKPNSGGWTKEIISWEKPENQEICKKLSPCTPWRFLNGKGQLRGRLIGGCLEVISWLVGTPLWPEQDAWNNAIFFLETSEDAPPPEEVKRFLRHMAAIGVLERISALLFVRPGGQYVAEEQFADYDRAVLEVVLEEYGYSEMGIVSNLDFGHSDPMLTLPMGVSARIDFDSQKIFIDESAVQ